MSHTMVIASRELRERKRVFLMAAAMAVLPFLATLLPAAKGNRPEVIGMVSGFLAVALCLGTALAYGATTIAGDLAERRLSFYFSKPVSPAALWFGKTLAAMAASIACFAIIAVPSMLVIGSNWRNMWLGNALSFGILGLAMVVLYLFTHALSTMVRSRSVLVGVDFVLLVATVGAIFFIVRPVLLGGAQRVALTMLIAIGVAFLAILAGAPVWQLAQGRTDIKRSHAALSRVLWIAVAVVLVVASAYVMWLVSVDVDDLKEIVDVRQSPAGNAVTITGVGSGRGDYVASFLVDSANNRTTKLSSPAWWGDMHFSQDGRVAAWLQPVFVMGPNWQLELYTRRLDQPDAKIIATGISAAAPPSLVLSADGSRAAVVHGGTISVYDLGRNKLLTSVGIESGSRKMFFMNNDVLRVLKTRIKSATIDIADLNVPAKKMTTVGQIEATSIHALSFSADGSRLVNPRRGVLADGRTGATIATLPVTAQSMFTGVALPDGGVAVVKRDAANVCHLYTFDANGQPVRDITLPAYGGFIAGQLGDHKLIISAHVQPKPAPHGQNRRIFVVDLAKGAIERTIDAVKGPMPQYSEPRLMRYRDGQQFTGVDANGKLVKW